MLESLFLVTTTPKTKRWANYFEYSHTDHIHTSLYVLHTRITALPTKPRSIMKVVIENNCCLVSLSPELKRIVVIVGHNRG